MKKFFQEFKKFITRGNVMDMSVGVIVGGAFTSIVTALSNNILKPIINWLLALILGQSSLSNIYTYLKKVTKVVDGVEVVDLEQSIYIDWGSFINAIINFIIIAFVLFCIVKVINNLADTSKNALDINKRIEYKQEKGYKLSKKEKKFLVRMKEEVEAKQKEEEAKKLKEQEDANKLSRSEELLVEIRDLLAKNK